MNLYRNEILDALDKAKEKMLDREYNRPTGSLDNPWELIVSKEIYELLKPRADMNDIVYDPITGYSHLNIIKNY